MRKALFILLGLSAITGFVVYKNKKQATQTSSNEEDGEIKPLYLFPVNKLNNFNIESRNERSEIENFKIVVYGHSKIKEKEIIKIVQKYFKENCNVDLRKSDIKALVSNEKKNLKKITPVKMLLSNRYKYLIAGPHPHSVQGKDLNLSWAKFLEKNNIETKVFDAKNKILTKRHLLDYLDEIKLEIMDKSFPNVA